MTGNSGKRSQSDAEQPINIGGQAVRSTAYVTVSSVVTLVLGLFRSIILARLLLPEYFGVIAMSTFYLDLVGRIINLGLDSAVIHHQGDDEQFLSNYGALRIGLGILTAAVGLTFAPLLRLFYPSMPDLAAVTRALALVSCLAAFSQVQEVILRKQLSFRKLAAVDISSSIVMTIVAPVMAWQGAGIWALVAEQASGIAVRAILCWGLLRPWNPRFHLDRSTVKWFWAYGWPVWTNGLVSYLLDRISDFWVGTRLGGLSLGYYTKAFEYARYPRRVIATPLVTVAQPVFARLQHDRQRLSQTFTRLAALLVRVGLGTSVIGLVCAPPLITLLLGDKWQPMTVILQLLLVYSLLDPLVFAAENLLLAVGKTQALAQVRIWQLGAFVVAILVFTKPLGAAGIALAVDLMSLVGAVLLFRAARGVVDYSPRTLFGWPIVAGFAAAAAGAGSMYLIQANGSAITSNPQIELLLQFVGAGASSILAYLGILWISERRQIVQSIREVKLLWQQGNENPYDD